MKRLLIFLTLMIAFMPWQMNGQTVAKDFKYPDSVNRTDSYGNKFGYWIEKQGEMTYKGEYVTNKKVKNWIGYYPNNFIYKVEYFSNGVKDGISLQFDRHGKITILENYKNGLAHGQTVYYSQYSETPLSETEYTNGKKNGLFRQYYDNAKLQEDTWFKDDLKNGKSKWFNKNGQMIAEYNYKDGNFDGIQKTFYENDTVQSVSNYIDNKQSGESKEYYRNGKLKLSGKYLLGQKDGLWTEYDELGKVTKVTRFKEGEEEKKKSK